MADDLFLFSDERDRTYARVPQDGHLESWPVESRRFRTWLSHRFYTQEDEVPSSSVLADALGVIEGRAMFEGDTLELGNRIKWHDGALWYDLADDRWRAVRVDETGWQVVEDPPPLFRRYAHQGAQVEPVEGGDVDEAFRFVNIADGEDEDSDDRILLKVWLVTALLADVPRAILIAWGPQGSAKSFLARILRALVDPSAVPMPRFPRGDDEMAQVLDHHAAPFFDNLSGLSERYSDTLCRAVTGDGFSKRKLYSDDDDVIRAYKRVILLNGINVPATKPDLLDRSILLKLDRISEENRQDERELMAAFEPARPRIFGAMLTALSEAMAIYPTVELERTPRMADWTRWGYAIAEALGIGGERFLGAYRRNRKDQNLEALGSHPVGAAVLSFMADRSRWEGSPSELLEALEEVAEAHKIDTRHELWPGSASWLSRRLGEVETNLQEEGIEWSRGSEGKDRALVLRRMGDGVDGVEGADSDGIDGNGGDGVEMPSNRNPLSPKGSDGTDATDGISQTSNVEGGGRSSDGRMGDGVDGDGGHTHPDDVEAL